LPPVDDFRGRNSRFVGNTNISTRFHETSELPVIRPERRVPHDLDECIGNFASTEPMKRSSPDLWQLPAEFNAGMKSPHADGWSCYCGLLHFLSAAPLYLRAHIATAFITVALFQELISSGQRKLS
jgi:hypothetical protein